MVIIIIIIFIGLMLNKQILPPIWVFVSHVYRISSISIVIVDSFIQTLKDIGSSKERTVFQAATILGCVCTASCLLWLRLGGSAEEYGIR